MTREPPQYVVARLRHSLATDPRTAEQGVRVEVRGNTVYLSGDNTVYLSGDVVTAQRREMLTEVVTELAPGMEIRNNVRLVPAGPPQTTEELR